PRRAAGDGARAGRPGAARSLARVAGGRSRRLPLPLPRRARLPARDGHGRREARAPARRRRRADGARRAPRRHDRRARPVGGAARPARRRRAEAGDPVRAVPGARRSRRALRGAPRSPLVPRLRLSRPMETLQPASFRPDEPGAAAVTELVADLLAATALVA